MKTNSIYYLQTEEKHTPDLFHATQDLLKDIQKDFDGTFLTFWQAESTSIGNDDAIALRTFLMAHTEKKPLFLFMRTLGGSVAAALKIIHMLHDLFHPITLLIPLNSCSAGTTIALAAHEIQMGSLGSFTPIDISVHDELSPTGADEKPSYISEENLNHILKLLKEHYKDQNETYLKDLFTFIHPLVMGRLDRVGQYSEKAGIEALQRRFSKLDVDKGIIEKLNRDFPAHGYPISRHSAKNLGLPVIDLIPALENKLLSLNQLYSEICQLQHTCLGRNDRYLECATTILEKAGAMAYAHSSERSRYIKKRKEWMDVQNYSGWMLQEEGKSTRPWYF